MILSAVVLFQLFLFVVCAAVSEEMSASSMWSSLKASLVQYPLEGNLTVPQVTTKVEKYVIQAVSVESQLVVLPELFSCDLLDLAKPEIPQFEGMLANIYPEFIDQLQALAVKHGVYLLAGSVPALVEGRIRNRSYLFSPLYDKTSNSSLPIFQEKLFLTPSEVEWGWEGSNKLSIIDAPWGRTAILICYDSEFPLLSQLLAAYDIDVILVPSQTGDDGFTRVRWSVQARAIEHMAYVMVTGTVGDPAEGWYTTAQGAFLGPSLPNFPSAPLIAEGSKGVEDIVHASVDLQALRAAKATGKYCPSADERGRTVLLDHQRIA